MAYLLIFSIVLLIVGVLLLLIARRDRRATGLPTGEIVYTDTGAWEEVEKPLFSRRYGVVGRPDYLVQVKEGGRTVTIPVEVKSRQRPPSTPDNHILQLATYCLLVEDTTKQRPPYGLLHYADATLKIAFTDALRREVLATADAIRAARTADDVHRQHDDPARCRGCGYRHACGEEI